MKKEKYYKLEIRDDTSILEINCPKGKYPKFFETYGDKLYIYWAKRPVLKFNGKKVKVG